MKFTLLVLSIHEAARCCQDQPVCESYSTLSSVRTREALVGEDKATNDRNFAAKEHDSHPPKMNHSLSMIPNMCFQPLLMEEILHQFSSLSHFS